MCIRDRGRRDHEIRHSNCGRKDRDPRRGVDISEGQKTSRVDEEWSDMGLDEVNELAERFDVWETPVVHYALDLSAP